jgi:hypothetical protein
MRRRLQCNSVIVLELVAVTPLPENVTVTVNDIGPDGACPRNFLPARVSLTCRVVSPVFRIHSLPLNTSTVPETAGCTVCGCTEGEMGAVAWPRRTPFSGAVALDSSTRWRSPFSRLGGRKPLRRLYMNSSRGSPGVPGSRVVVVVGVLRTGGGCGWQVQLVPMYFAGGPGRESSGRTASTRR